MRLFQLEREVDATGVSGTGIVAQGVIFDNGWCALTWLTKHTSVAFYTDIAEVVSIHGHDGSTKVVQIADTDGAAGLCLNEYQDRCEGVGNDFTSGNHLYMWEQREKFSKLFDRKDLAERNSCKGTEEK